VIYELAFHAMSRVRSDNSEFLRHRTARIILASHRLLLAIAILGRPTFSHILIHGFAFQLNRDMKQQYDINYSDHAV